MAGFPASITLSGMSSGTGFQLVAEAAGDNEGISISSAGDVNGDGIDDFIVGSVWNDTGGANAGAAYVVFGGTGGFPQNFAASGLDGTNGFRIYGKTAGDYLGWSVSGGGDLNGDGYDDLIVGAYLADPSGTNSGAAYVIFGHSGNFSSSVSVNGLDGSNGFAVTGLLSSDLAGFSVSIVGDFNGDGYDDMIVGAPFSDPGASNSGSTYMVFGHGGAFPASLSVGSLNGANGFRIAGLVANEQSGWSVQAAGDVNGDGLQDLIIGATLARNAGAAQTGGAYILFGSAGPFGGNMYLDNPDQSTALNGANGVKLIGETSGDLAGWSVAAAGDVNGDGFDDVVVGAPYNSAAAGHAGAAYVVFGKAGGFSSTLNLAALDGSNGFRIYGPVLNSRVGKAVAAGDVNGDGYSDLIIGAPQDGNNNGAAYVVFGHGGSFAASVSLQGLDGTNGLVLNGASGSLAGRGVGAADVNGDGVDDILVGAPVALSPDNSSVTGAAYVVYGQPSAITWTGGAGDETRNGGTLDDTLSGGAGKDVLNGLGGADILNGDDGNDTLSGGDGVDTLHGGLNNDIVGGDAGDDTLYGDEGNDKVNGGDGADHLFGGDGADWMDGGVGDDVLEGGAGNDNLDGGAGADAMTGGAGNDVYYLDDEGDTVIEAAGEGTDIVRSTLHLTLLGDNVENLQLLGSALIGTGNDLANNIQGNALSNILSGGGGVDTINGGDGNDSISGGTGNDILYGGAGADTFAVAPESLYTSKAPAGGHLEIDFVRDFSTAEGDKINLGSIDADTTVGGDQAFHLVSAFTRHGGEMTLAYNAAANLTVMSLDVDGDGRADYQMKINGDVHADSAGWIL